MINRKKQLRAVAILTCLTILGAGNSTAALASDTEKEYPFSAMVYGPGENNLSSSDYYAQYQWGLKNDGELQYLEIVNRFRNIDPYLANYIDLANYFGLPSPVEGPGAYELETTEAIRGMDVNVQPAWQLYDEKADQPKREVVVAVIDTGIDVNHPNLSGSIWQNSDEIPNDGIDNDGNGYIDDINGWNFFDNNNQVYTGRDDNHGTHAAGTIAATRNKGGIAGIADNNYVKLMSLKALGTAAGVGEEGAVIAAIRYAEANGASICNLSFGTLEHYPSLEQVIRDSKMLFVVAAGNGDAYGIGVDIDVVPDYPACYDYDNIITVANLMFDGNLAVSSNYGVKNVDIAAPGTYIVSTIADSGYGYMTGTSMSAPMVTAAAAFLYSYRTDISLADVKPILMNSSKKLEGLNGKIASGGLLDIYAAITYGQQ